MPYRSSDDSAATCVAIIGQLREGVAAVRNLEHLVASINAGPQLLARVVPEVAALLDGMPELLLKAGECGANSGLEICPDAWHAMVGGLLEDLGRLSGFLHRHGGSLNARPRLELHALLHKTRPRYATAVAHLELLMDALYCSSTPLPVRELLQPEERGSDRPYRPVGITGSGLSAIVSVPPPVMMKCLSLFVDAGVTERAEQPALSVELAEASTLSFRLIERGSAASKVRLPAFSCASYSLPVMNAALSTHGGRCSAEMLLLPIVAER